MEAVGTQLKEVVHIPGKAARDLISAPIATIAMILFVVLIVLLVEAYKPGLLTSIPRKILLAVGLKSA